MKTAKSPRRVLTLAYLIGQVVLQPYANRFSPKKFTQPQLFACLVFKEFMHLHYRKLEATLADAPEFCRAIELEKVPHFTTFHKASKRLLRLEVARKLLETTIHVAQEVGRVRRRIRLAALDATGFESRHASSYYVRRRAKGGKSRQETTSARFPKAGILCDTRSPMILAIVPGRGPGPDIKHFRQALDEGLRAAPIEALTADAGYDSEESHHYARMRCGVRWLIPPLIGRPTTKPPQGYWRRQMKIHLKHSRYTQRWQLETVHSMIQRLLGSALRARTSWSQFREMLLRATTPGRKI